MKPIVANSKKQSANSKTKLDQKSKKDDTSKSLIMVNVTSAFGPDVAKLKSISFKVLLKCTNEQFIVKKFPVSMKVRELKSLLEFVCGIPYNLQRLSYLDDGELIDPKEMTYYDVIEGAVIMMDVWNIYLDLVKAVISADNDLVLKQGVSQTIDWTSPAADYMFIKDKSNYIKERSGIAMFIAAHRGNLNLIKTLFNHGGDINYKSSFGRTPIQIAVVADQMKIIDFLLENDADVEVSDLNGDNAISTAKKFSNKLAQHRLAQFKWKKRLEEESKSKKEIKVQKEQPITIFTDERYPHQVFDSSKKTWYKGNYMQMYMAQLVPQGEYSGTSFSAPKSVGIEVLRQYRSNSELNKSMEQVANTSLNENSRASVSQSGNSFENWLKEKKKKEDTIIKAKKSAEAYRKMLLENASDYTREASAGIEPDTKSQWPSNTNSKFAFGDQSSTGKKPNSAGIFKSSDDRMSNISSARTKKKQETNVIYKGMPYEEWSKIRDKFLETHNMV